ncbi:MAG: class I SAM-dependent methyltransferase, partial [Acidimicrobiales bacterium]
VGGNALEPRVPEDADLVLRHTRHDIGGESARRARYGLSMAAGTSHYFDEDPSTASRARVVELVLPDLTVDLVSDRGVFAADRVDVGTRYLLLEAPPLPEAAAHVLDLGCGYGAIARTLAHRAPQACVWAVDVNKRALALTRTNLTGLNAKVVAPTNMPADIRFDTIWSNPPIRIGKAALHELLSHWLDRLTPNGCAVLVVQKHLGADSLTRWLTEQGWDTERLGSRSGYRLLHVEPR